MESPIHAIQKHRWLRQPSNSEQGWQELSIDEHNAIRSKKKKVDVAASGGISDNMNLLAIPKSTKMRGTQKVPKKGHLKYHSKSAANRLLKACEDLLITAQCTINKGDVPGHKT